jgi:UDP-2,3-diacylglucosamine hydrolase
MPGKKKIPLHRSTRKKTRRQKVYFFSDAHLGIGSEEEDREKERRILRFLNSIQTDAQQLFIVGDLFDYWFEYKTVVPKKYFRLFSKLAELSEAGVRISFIAGNHDFWVKDYFLNELGIEIYLLPLETEILGKRFLLHHGDGLLKDDVGYRILKKILRNRVSIFLYSLLHPDISGGIARWSSHTSRQYTSNRTYEGNGMIEFAARKIQEGFDFVVMGHNHVASYRTLGHGVYVNLGDWIVENTYAVFDGKKMELKTWNN